MLSETKTKFQGKNMKNEKEIDDDDGTIKHSGHQVRVFRLM